MNQTLQADDRTRNDVRRVTYGKRRDRDSELRSPRGATSVRRRRETRAAKWIDEGHRREKLTPVRQHWEHRATRLNRKVMELQPGSELDKVLRQRAYAVARVARLTADIAPRLDGCGLESLAIACACGLVGAKKTCRQWWLCGDCRAKRTPTLGHDIRKGLDWALSAAVTEWGAQGGIGVRPQLVLMTLTTLHTGDLVADQTALAEGWRKLYKRMHEDHGACPYVGVWEVTPGKDGLGHVHIHLALVWRYRDWGRIREQWLNACPSSQYLTFVAKRKDGKASSAGSVAKYLSKYLAKGADLRAFTPHLRAEVSAAFYNQRSVLSSERFWRRVTKCCKKCHERYRLAPESITVDVWYPVPVSKEHPNGWRFGVEPPPLIVVAVAHSQLAIAFEPPHVSAS